MTKKYLVTYLIDGVKKTMEVNAKNEYDAKRCFYNSVNIYPTYVDHAILSIINEEEYIAILSLFNA